MGIDGGSHAGAFTATREENYVHTKETTNRQRKDSCRWRFVFQDSRGLKDSPSLD